MLSRPEGFNFEAAKEAAHSVFCEGETVAVDPGMGAMAILLAQHLVLELHVLNKMLPPERRLDLCESCGSQAWTRPYLPGIEFEMDFTRRVCRTCSKVRTEPGEDVQ